ncbi:MAG: anti-sigma factor antagonist [Chloroflexi bacterium]|nr:MAG: anti-anti-sigma factor [Phototrophicales bacterium]RMF78652.1 MAG: anti-sigma factor antagonist [Chloroflexota bacterium]
MIEVNVAQQGQVAVITVVGRVDSNTASEFDASLTGVIDKGTTQIVVDLSAVNYMSSAGLRVLVSALQKVQRVSGDVRLVQPTERVQEIIEMSGMDTIFQIFSTQVAATNSYTN